jgi:transposase
VSDCEVFIATLQKRIEALEAEIRRRAKRDVRVESLMAIPDVGLLTTMTLVAEIGDITRFATARKLCAWAGLTPSMRNSDRTIRHGPHHQGQPPRRCATCSARRPTSPSAAIPTAPTSSSRRPGAGRESPSCAPLASS